MEEFLLGHPVVLYGKYNKYSAKQAFNNHTLCRSTLLATGSCTSYCCWAGKPCMWIHEFGPWTCCMQSKISDKTNKSSQELVKSMF